MISKCFVPTTDLVNGNVDSPAGAWELITQQWGAEEGKER